MSCLVLSPCTALIQYVGDLLLTVPSTDQWGNDTLTLLRYLATEGHKAKFHKLQFVQEKVKFIGHSISASVKLLDSSRNLAIQNIA